MTRGEGEGRRTTITVTGTDANRVRYSVFVVGVISSEIIVVRLNDFIKLHSLWVFSRSKGFTVKTEQKPYIRTKKNVFEENRYDISRRFQRILAE